MIYLIGLAIAFALVLLLSNRKTRNCRWRARGGADAAGVRPYRCVACGAETTTRTGKAPDICLDRPAGPGNERRG